MPPAAPKRRSLTRAFLLLGALTVVPLAAALFFVMSSSERSINLLSASVQRFTSYELELVNPRLSWMPLHFQSDLFLLHYANRDGPPMVSLQAVDLQMSMKELLLGNVTRGHFRARNVTYYLDESSNEAPLNLEALLSPLSRLPNEMTVESLHLISRSDNVWIFPLYDLQAMRNDVGSIDATAQTTIANRQTLLTARAMWSVISDGKHRLDLSATVVERDDQSSIEVLGSVEADGPLLSYDFGVEGAYERVSDFLSAFDENAYPFAGNLTVSGTLRGDLQGYTLDVEKLGLSSEDVYAFTAAGTIRQRDNQSAVLELSARGNARQMNAFLPGDTQFANGIQNSELQLNIVGTLENPEISRLALVLFAAGGTRLELISQSKRLQISELQALSPAQEVHAEFVGSTADLAALLSANDIDSGAVPMLTGEFAGEIHGRLDDLKFDVNELTLRHANYVMSGSSRAIWHNGVLSMPAIDLTIREQADAGSLTAKGTIADLSLFRGVALQLAFSDLSPNTAFETLDIEPPLALHRISGSGLALRAATTLQIRDLSLRVESYPDIAIQLDGQTTISDDEIDADMQISNFESTDEAWAALNLTPQKPSNVSGTLRLRPSYLTLLADFGIGSTALQSVVSAELAENSIKSLAIDLYTRDLHLNDFAAPAKSTASTAPQAPLDLGAVRDALPPYPVHLSLRSGHVAGALSDLSNLTLAVDADQGALLLRELDARYAGGELILRGVIDTRVSPPAISLAGRGIRVPLGALTQDLGLQQSVTGAMSLRGGLVTRGYSAADWQANLQGRLSTALTDVTVSGAAYDLLMSNILAWIVQGAGEKTTTFDCTMAQLDFDKGVARSDSLYIETPRMLATGKATIDLPGNALDVRIEPRSKTRTFQFPSAVRLGGKLDAPVVRVSPLQTTADLSAQALLLLPSLTLKLFGVTGADDQLRPCNTQAP